MCHSVQGKKGDQYCELGFPKGMNQGDESASQLADRDNRCTRVSPGRVLIRPHGLSVLQRPASSVGEVYLHVALGSLLSFSIQGPFRASNQPMVNMDIEGCRLSCT